MVSLMHSGSVSLVFCSWDLAITPSATPHPRFECLHEGTRCLSGTRTDREQGSWSKIVPILH